MVGFVPGTSKTLQVQFVIIRASWSLFLKRAQGIWFPSILHGECLNHEKITYNLILWPLCKCCHGVARLAWPFSTLCLFFSLFLSLTLEGVDCWGPLHSVHLKDRRSWKRPSTFSLTSKRRLFSSRLLSGYLVWGPLLARPVGFRGHSKGAEGDQRGGWIIQNEDSGCSVCVGEMGRGGCLRNRRCWSSGE